MDNLIEKKSRTAVKREAEGLQKLGERLACFSVDQIKAMNIPEELKKAVLNVKSIKKFGAKRRQYQYIGSIMRKIDPDIVVNAMDKISMGRYIALEKIKQIEKWRDDFINDPDDFIEKFISLYPQTDRQRLRNLIRNVRNASNGDNNSRFMRPLFKYIRQIVDESGKLD